MLASLGRCCWKQVRLGRRGDPAVQEKALVGNTIFFAQPTGDVPSMQLPPPQDALVDHLNVIFTRSLHDLSKAEWAIVNRREYMRIVRERKSQCPAFSDVTVCEAEAISRLPENGVPEHIRVCAVEVEGAEHTDVRLQGPASRAPDVGHQADAAGESESASESEHEATPEHGDADKPAASSADAALDVAELSIAVDSVHAVKPVQMMQALQGNLQALQSQAASILLNEKKARVQTSDGALQPVPDEGGRHCFGSLILDLQSTARGFDDAAQASVERAVAASDCRLNVCPSALAIPTQGPLDSFNSEPR